MVQFAAYTGLPPNAGFATTMPTSVIRPAGKVRRMLFAVELRKEVSWGWFVVLRRK